MRCRWFPTHCLYPTPHPILPFVICCGLDRFPTLPPCHPHMPPLLDGTDGRKGSLPGLISPNCHTCHVTPTTLWLVLHTHTHAHFITVVGWLILPPLPHHGFPHPLTTTNITHPSCRSPPFPCPLCGLRFPLHHPPAPHRLNTHTPPHTCPTVTHTLFSIDYVIVVCPFPRFSLIPTLLPQLPPGYPRITPHPSPIYFTLAQTHACITGSWLVWLLLRFITTLHTTVVKLWTSFSYDFVPLTVSSWFVLFALPRLFILLPVWTDPDVWFHSLPRLILLIDLFYLPFWLGLFLVPKFLRF